MAAIFNYQTADTISAGLQGCKTCDEAIQAARRIAATRGEAVVLEDDDGVWLVDPNGEREEIESDWA